MEEPELPEEEGQLGKEEKKEEKKEEEQEEEQLEG